MLLHELGHLYDLRVMNNGDRGRFRQHHARSAGAHGGQGEIPLAEQFAEAYSFCARYRRIVSIARYSTYDYRPRGASTRRSARSMLDAAVDRQPSAPPPQAPAVTRPDPAPPAQPPTTTVPGSGGTPATQADSHADPDADADRDAPPRSGASAGADDPADPPGCPARLTLARSILQTRSATSAGERGERG